MDSPQKADAGGRPRALRWPALCWIAVLLMIGIVQIVRAQWVDTGVFFAAAGLVAVSPWAPPRPSRRVPLRAMVAGAATAGLVVCVAPRHSAGAVAAVTAVGVVALALAWAGSSAGPRPWPPALRRLGWAWAGLVIAGCLWELAQFILSEIFPGSPAYALSNLLDPLLDGDPGRIAFATVWVASGAFLLLRGGRR